MLRPAVATFLAAALLLTTGCEDDATPGAGLALVPTKVYVGGEPVTVQGLANRDFMPGAANDSLAFRTEVHSGTALVNVERVWVVHEQEVWSSSPYRASPYEGPDGVNAWLSFNGPRWPVGDEIFVVAEIRPTTGGDARRVRSLPVAITESH